VRRHGQLRRWRTEGEGGSCGARSLPASDEPSVVAFIIRPHGFYVAAVVGLVAIFVARAVRERLELRSDGSLVSRGVLSDKWRERRAPDAAKRGVP